VIARPLRPLGQAVWAPHPRDFASLVDQPGRLRQRHPAVFYKRPDAAGLLGHRTPEVRKALGLGAATHVAEITSIDQVHPLVAAVCVANGLKAPKAPAKGKGTRKPTPSTGMPVTSSESDAGQVGGTKAGPSGHAAGTEEVK
jgi:hypothetical protein